MKASGRWITAALVSVVLATPPVSPEETWYNDAPAWSPDGRYVAFHSNREQTGTEMQVRVFTLNLVSREIVALSDPALTSLSPAWSPDGTAVAFAARRGDNEDVFRRDADGSSIRLTDRPGLDSSPDWSPDGRRLAFASDRGAAHREIWLMNADGSDPNRLIELPGDAHNPRWSPDGRRLAFDMNVDSVRQLFTVDVETKVLTQLTRGAAANIHADWSPDGSRLAMHTDRDGNWEIYVISADGSGAVNVSNHAAADAQASWSPDGKRIAFWTNRDGPREIYVMASDGSRQERLTTTPERRPEESPPG